MTSRSGRDVLLEVLASEGIDHVFGNPGTTELPFSDELAAHPEITYVLALQENSAVAMADGYAQATGRPAFVNLHTATGLGGGMGNLVNAVANRSPLVVTAGQQDRRHLIFDPLLSGDLVGMAGTVSKWQYEVRRLDELAIILRRAFLDAASPPAGPVFVGIPMDVLEEVGDVDVPPRSTVERSAPAGGLEELADLLADAAPDQVAIVCGDGVGSSGALDEAAALGTALGARVFGTAWYSKLNFPTTHPCWAGMLPVDAAAIRNTLSPFRRVFVVGAQAVLVYRYSPGPALPPSAELLHLDADLSQIGRNYAARLGVVGDVKASLAALVPLVSARVDAARSAAAVEAAGQARRRVVEGVEGLAAERRLDLPMHPVSAVQAVVRGLPGSGVLVDESMSSSFHVRDLFLSDRPGSYYFGAAGGLGWAIPAAVGVKLARPEVPVLGVVGDGAAMYAIQALWTAAHYHVPVVACILNNRQYGILKAPLAAMGGRSAALNTFVGMDMVEPPVNFVEVARGLGVDAAVVEKAGDVTDAVAAALESERPCLLELPVAPPEVPGQSVTRQQGI